MKLRSLMFACALAAAPVVVAYADPLGPHAATKISDVDAHVIAHMHAVNQTEIELGKLAQRNGTAAVRAYGHMLVKDHTAFDRKLLTYSREHGLSPIPEDTSMSASEKLDMDNQKAHLRTLSGNAFDHELLPMMAAAHDKELAKADANIALVDDAKLKTMIQDFRPTLQHHADEARRLMAASHPPISER